MHRIAALLLFSAALLPLAAQDAPSRDELYQRAVALHDKGDYDGAIAIYKQLLERNPADESVQYEMTFSTYSKGDMAETVRLASAGAKKRGESQVAYLEILGNAYDSLGQTNNAIDAYKRGISVAPTYARIHFNLGVTYARQQKYRDAREELGKAIDLKPAYASPQYWMGEVYRADGYRIPALLAYARFVTLEPEGDRAAAAAKQLDALMNLGVSSKDGRNINITVDPHPKKDLGDFSGLEMTAALLAGAQQTSDEKTTEFEKHTGTLSTLLTILSESASDMKRSSVAKKYLPFFIGMVSAKQSDTFAHVALAPLKLAGTDEWMAAHQADVAAYREWLRSVTPR